MRYSDKCALFYTILALIIAVTGYIKQIEAFLYCAVLLVLISFYWLFRDKTLMKFWSKK